VTIGGGARGVVTIGAGAGGTDGDFCTIGRASHIKPKVCGIASARP
jgi:hypothetical protein